jgi:hypothetical protein
VDFFYYLAGRLEDLDGHGLLAGQALQLLDLLLELADPAGRHDVFAGRHRGRPATLDEPHPVPKDARRDPELPGKLGEGLLTRDNPGHRLSLEVDREHPATIGLPCEFRHFRLPF